MNINRNVLQIVAGVLLVASLPAGAQVLGGGLGGAANGALGGGLGQGIHGNGGIMGGGSIAGPDAVGAAGKARDRVQQAGQRTRDAAAQTKDGATQATRATRSKVEQARGAATATGQAIATAGAAADGATSGGFEKQALGRDVSANGSTASSGRADRSGLDANMSKQADVSAKKSEPAAVTPAP